MSTCEYIKERRQTSVRRRPIQSRRPQIRIFACLIGLLGFALPIVTPAQNVEDAASLKKQIDALEEGQKKMQEELEDILKLLTPPEKPVPTSLDLAADDTPFRGEKTAKVTLVEYFDYQCPFCARYFDETEPQVLANYILKGNLKFIVRDFPLTELHRHALQAAEAARCANDQGKFWPMHDALMGNSDALDRAKLSLYAQDVGLDLASFDKCVDSDEYAGKIKESMINGEKLGVDGTPTFFLGVTDASGQRIMFLQRMEGAIPYPKLKEAIDKLLAEQKTPTGTPASH